MENIIKILKKQYKIIIGVFIGLVIATGISYGVNNIQSSSVSYTKDGKVMSVKQAIDDLIVKVNGKGSCGVFSITLKEQKMSLSDTKNISWLKEFVDKSLSQMFNDINNFTEIETEELTKLKNGNYTWGSSDTSILIVDGNNAVPKKEGSVKAIATTSGGATVKIPLKIERTSVLSDVVSVGDYVAYDAGTWTSSADRPISQGQFGGYTSGQNKANSVACYDYYGTTTLKGWRVFSIDASTKTVNLIHAGQPECYYHRTNLNESITNLNNRAASTYLNIDYANSAHMMNYDEAFTITGSGSATTNNLRNTGDWYWLAAADPNGELSRVVNNGAIGSMYNISFGVRPVVVLKAGITTTGKGTDMVGQTAWTLVKP